MSGPSTAPVKILSTGLTATENPPLRVIGGRGSRLTLDDGRAVIDASNTSAPLGHRHPELIAAVRRAADSPALNEGWGWHGRDEAVAALVNTAFEGDAGWVGAVRFCSSGSEANDLALSLAQALTGRRALVTRERSYHGGTGLAREATLQPHWHGGLSARAGGVLSVPKPTPVRELPQPRCTAGHRDSWCEHVGRCTCVPAADELLADAAALIIDYSQGGVYASPLYQDALAAAARRAGALWIADEVVTALGRTGRWLNFTYGESSPDIVTLGKPLAGGIAPAAAVVVSERILDEMKGHSWQSYGTFRGHPLAVAPIAPTLETIEREDLITRAAKLDQALRASTEQLTERHPSLERAAGLGLHWTLELTGGDWQTWLADTSAPPIATRVADEALTREVLIATSGEEASLFLAPPLNISTHDLELTLEALDFALTAADKWLIA